MDEDWLPSAQEFVAYMAQKIQLLKHPSGSNSVPKELVENWQRFENLNFEKFPFIERIVKRIEEQFGKHVDHYLEHSSEQELSFVSQQDLFEYNVAKSIFEEHSKVYKQLTEKLSHTLQQVHLPSSKSTSPNLVALYSKLYSMEQQNIKEEAFWDNFTQSPPDSQQIAQWLLNLANPTCAKETKTHCLENLNRYFSDVLNLPSTPQFLTQVFQLLQSSDMGLVTEVLNIMEHRLVDFVQSEDVLLIMQLFCTLFVKIHNFKSHAPLFSRFIHLFSQIVKQFDSISMCRFASNRQLFEKFYGQYIVWLELNWENFSSMIWTLPHAKWLQQWLKDEKLRFFMLKESTNLQHILCDMILVPISPKLFPVTLQCFSQMLYTLLESQLFSTDFATHVILTRKLLEHIIEHRQVEWTDLFIQCILLHRTTKFILPNHHSHLLGFISSLEKPVAHRLVHQFIERFDHNIKIIPKNEQEAFTEEWLMHSTTLQHWMDYLIKYKEKKWILKMCWHPSVCKALQKVKYFEQHRVEWKYIAIDKRSEIETHHSFLQIKLKKFWNKEEHNCNTISYLKLVMENIQLLTICPLEVTQNPQNLSLSTILYSVLTDENCKEQTVQWFAQQLISQTPLLPECKYVLHLLLMFCVWKDYRHFSPLIPLAIQHQQAISCPNITLCYHLIWNQEAIYSIMQLNTIQHSPIYSNHYLLQLLYEQHCHFNKLELTTLCSSLSSNHSIFGIALLQSNAIPFCCSVEWILKMEYPTLYHSFCNNTSLLIWIQGWIQQFFVGTLHPKQIEYLLTLLLQKGVVFVNYLMVCMFEWIDKVRQLHNKEDYCCEWTLQHEKVEWELVTQLEQLVLQRELLYKEFEITEQIVQKMNNLHEKYHPTFIQSLAGWIDEDLLD